MQYCRGSVREGNDGIGMGTVPTYKTKRVEG